MEKRKKIDIDLKEVSGINYDPMDETFCVSSIGDEINHIKSIIQLLGDSVVDFHIMRNRGLDPQIGEESTMGYYHTFQWIQERLKALRDHLINVSGRLEP